MPGGSFLTSLVSPSSLIPSEPFFQSGPSSRVTRTGKGNSPIRTEPSARGDASCLMSAQLPEITKPSSQPTAPAAASPERSCRGAEAQNGPVCRPPPPVPPETSSLTTRSRPHGGNRVVGTARRARPSSGLKRFRATHFGSRWPPCPASPLVQAFSCRRDPPAPQFRLQVRSDGRHAQALRSEPAEKQQGPDTAGADSCPRSQNKGN